MKRQFHLIPPWGNEESTSSSAVLLLEIPATEPFTYSLTLISSDLVHVTIHAGKSGDTATRWCTSWIFICTSDGAIDERVYSGDMDINPPDPTTGEVDLENSIGLLDWQEWAYHREIDPIPATDPFSRSYQQAYLPDAARPPYEPPEGTLEAESAYLDFKPATTTATRTFDRGSEGDENNLPVEPASISREVFDFQDAQRDEIASAALSDQSVQLDGIRKSPSDDPTSKSGDTVQLTGLGAGWSSTRIEGSKARVLAISGVYE